MLNQSVRIARFSLPRAILIVACALQVSISRAAVPAPPGVVISHFPASSGIYIGSPSIAILPSGDFIASHDGFGPKHEFGRTYLFRSEDGGDTWQSLGQVDGQGTSTLFVHNSSLYLMGLGHRSVVIRQSTDGGKTWTVPADNNKGLILSSGRFSTAPTPVLVHEGRIWRAMEVVAKQGRWAIDHHPFMLSAAVDSDLLRADSWTPSNSVPTDVRWLDGTFGGWLEGNAVAAPDREVVIILRVHYQGYEGNKAAMVKVSRDGKATHFEPVSGFIGFPGGAKKFTIRFDPASDQYWSLTNFVPKKHRHGGGHLHPGGNPESTRNTLVLISSPDLHEWSIRSILLYHPDTAKHGFQYVDWQFDGNDIVAVSRTAFDDGFGGAHDMHDANYLTFHRVVDFRSTLSTEVNDPLGLLDD